METLTISSPDGRKSIELVYAGEVRFGPAFFTCSSAGFPWPLGQVFIGEDVHWSPDSRFVVILVFHSIDASKAPSFELIAIDTELDKTYSLTPHCVHSPIYQIGFTSASEYEFKTAEHDHHTTHKWTTPSTSNKD